MKDTEKEHDLRLFKDFIMLPCGFESAFSESKKKITSVSLSYKLENISSSSDAVYRAKILRRLKSRNGSGYKGDFDEWKEGIYFLNTFNNDGKCFFLIRDSKSHIPYSVSLNIGEEIDLVEMYGICLMSFGNEFKDYVSAALTEHFLKCFENIKRKAYRLMKERSES